MSHRYIVRPIFGLSRFVDEFSADTSAEYFSREQDQELPVDVVVKKINQVGASLIEKKNSYLSIQCVLSASSGLLLFL